jgi:hypothetical protein
MSGNLALIGAPLARNNLGQQSGNAYLLDTTFRTWTDLSTTSTPDAWLNFDQVGSAVAISGRMAIIGAPQNNLRGSQAGNAFLVQFDPTAAAADLIFAGNPGAGRTIAPSLITAITSTGTNVTLQANNDITVNSAIVSANPIGNGGAITLQAGRSILVNANIVTDNANLILTANENRAAGVQDAYRDPGNAVISMLPGTHLDAGTANVNLNLREGAGGTFNGSSAITLQNVTAANVSVSNSGSSPGSNIIFAGPALTASNSLSATTSNGDIVLSANAKLTAGGPGNAMVLAGQTFQNSAGPTPLATPNGRFLVYANDPATNALGTFASPGNLFGRSFAADGPGSISSAFGSRMVYAMSPTLTIAADAKTKQYGDADPLLTFTASGLIAGDTVGTTVTGSLARNAGENVAGGPYAITRNTLSEKLGYTLAYNGAALTITPAPLTIRADDKTKVEGQQNPDFTATYTGFKFMDTAGSLTAPVQLSTTATTTSTAGAYAITPFGATSSNYAIKFVDGTLTVTLTPPPVVHPRTPALIDVAEKLQEKGQTKPLEVIQQLITSRPGNSQAPGPGWPGKGNNQF